MGVLPGALHGATSGRRGRGGGYHNLGQAQRAIDDYDEAIRRNPELAEGFAGLARAYMLLDCGNLNEGRQAHIRYATDEYISVDLRPVGQYRLVRCVEGATPRNGFDSKPLANRHSIPITSLEKRAI